jgi:hypothetical protein
MTDLSHEVLGGEQVDEPTWGEMTQHELLRETWQTDEPEALQDYLKMFLAIAVDMDDRESILSFRRSLFTLDKRLEQMLPPIQIPDARALKVEPAPQRTPEDELVIEPRSPRGLARAIVKLRATSDDMNVLTFLAEASDEAAADTTLKAEDASTEYSRDCTLAQAERYRAVASIGHAFIQFDDRENGNPSIPPLNVQHFRIFHALTQAT